ncbi:hypothetical protein PF005_g5265 [Phytophthora fragariae]|uniref:Secreted protein n=1 Tax=Phytophthora fragariae TaxID=53985 RepID=A0A6A4EAG5_9STRA|nr:hypothetical protein PF003_g36871 [Phytophthora fragariae]KAE8944622.1 hypothetical protein PF009_g5700 [Phytophthora fragariae]KAE9023366.1 hypothetical protein PF011_g4018 [Phytophthora fragariae]KAE9129036.1 hypothetical protein PF010_g4285 [Phytophthora fragariae]KAE9135556.1 hypothetical protein PF007_g2514 [Phytophthora fragariae]
MINVSTNQATLCLLLHLATCTLATFRQHAAWFCSSLPPGLSNFLVRLCKLLAVIVAVFKTSELL